MTGIANVEMAEAWDGEEGKRWAENADRYETAGRRHWRRFLDAELVSTHDRVLDVGCGSGQSTRDAATLATAGSALGVDLSSRMLAVARTRSAEAGITNVAFEQADAQVHPFPPQAFDVAISSFGAMFFGDPVAAFANIGAALHPGGKLALLTWREFSRNEWLTALRGALAAGRDLPEPPAGAPGPFGLADADATRVVLENAGFDDVAHAAVDEPIELGADATDAFTFVQTMGIVKGLTHDLDEATTARVLDEVRSVLGAHETPDGVLLGSAAWLITARRR